jgi:hypothetical protein
MALVRIYRPRAVIGWSGYFHVLIDGVDRGELWPNQVKTLQVGTGQHDIQLRQGLATKSTVLTFSTNGEKVAEFACSRFLTAVGLTGLHSATKEESLRMQKIVVEPPTPRNLAAPDDSHPDT